MPVRLLRYEHRGAAVRHGVVTHGVFLIAFKIKYSHPVEGIHEGESCSRNETEPAERSFDGYLILF